MKKIFWGAVLMFGLFYAIGKFSKNPSAPPEQVITGGVYTVTSGLKDYPYGLLRVLSQENRRIYVKFYRISWKQRPPSWDLNTVQPGGKDAYAAMRRDYFQGREPKLIQTTIVEPSELTPIAKKNPNGRQSGKLNRSPSVSTIVKDYIKFRCPECSEPILCRSVDLCTHCNAKIPESLLLKNEEAAFFKLESKRLRSISVANSVPTDLDDAIAMSDRPRCGKAFFYGAGCLFFLVAEYKWLSTGSLPSRWKWGTPTLRTEDPVLYWSTVLVGLPMIPVMFLAAKHFWPYAIFKRRK